MSTPSHALCHRPIVVAAITGIAATLFYTLTLAHGQAAIIHGASPAPHQHGITGTILHIVRVGSDGDNFESWTDASDGYSKEIYTHQGGVAGVYYEVRGANGTFADTTVQGGQSRTVSRRPADQQGRIPDGFWYGGERSMDGMRREFAGYRRRAVGGVARVLLHGVPALRFDAFSSDHLLGTFWLAGTGLPLQVEAQHNPREINTFPVIETLPPGSLPLAFFTSATLPPHGLYRLPGPRGGR